MYMNIQYIQLIKTKWFIGVGCLLFGAATILGIRFITYMPDTIHYHANFALYINGTRELFKSPVYYEETEACAVNAVITPAGRAHMHDNINDVVHVEDHAVTWGQFFANLGWVLGPDFIQAPNQTMYLENGDQKLHIVLNRLDDTGFGNIANNVIKDQDKLLISFGDETSAVLMQQYELVPNTIMMLRLIQSHVADTRAVH
jgi:hypothetical protein